MAKELAIVLFFLSCISVVLSLQCLYAQSKARQPPGTTKNCTTDAKLCSYYYDTTDGVYLKQDCAEGVDQKLTDTCKRETGKKKTAYCDIDLCNNKALYDTICVGGQAGLKSSFIFSFGSAIIWHLAS